MPKNKKPKPIIKELTEQEQLQCFTMNKSKWNKLYKLYTNERQFYKDMKLLIDNGFIEIIENGRLTRTKSIYILSNKWQTETPYPMAKYLLNLWQECNKIIK